MKKGEVSDFLRGVGFYQFFWRGCEWSSYLQNELKGLLRRLINIIRWDKSFCNMKSLTLVKREIIMGVVQIREDLYHYIAAADARLLKMLYAVAKEYTQDDYTLPGEPMNKETLKSRIRIAKSRIKAGQFTTQEDLEKEMKEW